MMELWWHVYCMNHWFDIAAETLACLRRAEFPAVVHAGVVGSEEDVNELRSLAGTIGVALQPQRFIHNAYEWPTLHALWQSCRDGGTVPIGYIHTKGVTRPMPSYSKWRWMMQAHIVLAWRDRVADLKDFDAVGCCYRPDWPCFAGNWWWARAGWIQGLREPLETADRFAHERWLLSRPGFRVKSLVSTQDEPCYPQYYLRHGAPHRPFFTA
jgi:hypothetical protein